MSDRQKPEHRLQIDESRHQQPAAGRETQRPTDSVPLTAGQFTQLPAKFGRYQIEKLLGRGTMGSVYLARDTQLDRLVAIKIPKVAASGSRRLLLRLETEAKAAAQLDHPSLCKVYDAGEVDGQCFIAMQYIEGETLKSQLESQHKSDAEIVSLIVQLAEGLSDAHALGIVHRDLKPENIMVNRRGVPMVMDFGLAKFATTSRNAAATQAGTIIGSPAYMSPEQANGNLKEIDQRSDIYALGTMLFEMLTGDWPFNGTAMQILGFKSLLDPPSPLTLRPDLHPQLAAVCRKMIANSNTNRHQTMSEVIADLKAIDLSAKPIASDVVAPELTQSFAGINDLDGLNPLDAQIRSLAEPKGRGRPSKRQRTFETLVGLLKRAWSAWAGQTPLTKGVSLGGLGAVVLALGVIVLFPTQHGTVQIDIQDPTLSVRFDGESITVDDEITITPNAAHRLEVLQNGIAVESLASELTLKKGEKRIVTVRMLKGNVVVDDGNTRREAAGKVDNRVTPDEPQGQPAVHSESATNVAEKGDISDHLLAGTVWKGTRTYRTGASSPNRVTYELYIRERNGTKFIGHVFDTSPNVNRAEVEGEIDGGRLHWTEKSLVYTRYLLTADGKLDGNKINLTFTRKYNENGTNEGDGELQLTSTIPVSQMGGVPTVHDGGSDSFAVTNGIGQWSIEGNELVQSQLIRENAALAWGNPEWKDYDYTFEAKVTGGSHGFKAIHHFTKDRSYSEFAVGNYDNTFHDVSSWRQGQWKRADGMAKPGTIKKNRWYKVRLEVRGAKVACYLDDTLLFNSDDPAMVSGRCGVSLYDAQVRFRNFLVTRPEDGLAYWSGLPDLSKINSK